MAADVDRHPEPVGPWRSVEDVVIGTDNVAVEPPACVLAESDGDLHFLTADRDEHTESLTNGNGLRYLNNPVYVRLIYGDSTVTALKLLRP